MHVPSVTDEEEYTDEKDAHKIWSSTAKYDDEVTTREGKDELTRPEVSTSPPSIE